jgi:hypothetical protein
VLRRAVAIVLVLLFDRCGYLRDVFAQVGPGAPLLLNRPQALAVTAAKVPLHGVTSTRPDLPPLATRSLR